MRSKKAFFTVLDFIEVFLFCGFVSVTKKTMVIFFGFANFFLSFFLNLFFYFFRKSLDFYFLDVIRGRGRVIASDLRLDRGRKIFARLENSSKCPIFLSNRFLIF